MEIVIAYSTAKYVEVQCNLDLVKLSLKGRLDSIPSPSPSVKTQVTGEKVCLRCKGKILLGVVNKLFVFKCFLTTHNNVLPLRLKLTFQPVT